VGGTVAGKQGAKLNNVCGSGGSKGQVEWPAVLIVVMRFNGSGDV
jgi:hypothetical protein